MKLTLKGVKEYFQMIPAIAQNLPKIWEGTVNQVKESFHMLAEDEQAEIIRRRIICAECPFNSSNAVVQLGYESSRIDEHCIMCGCTIARKTASLASNCGIDACNATPLDPDSHCKNKYVKDYNDENNINAELKWKAYKTLEDE